jgi:transcriptional regulator with XRE-family HTH domain
MSEAYLKEDLIELRKSLDFTQKQMAEEMGLSLRAYQAIEAGESEYRMLHRLAAERVAMMRAVDLKNPALAPLPVRQDAIALVDLLRT